MTLFHVACPACGASVDVHPSVTNPTRIADAALVDAHAGSCKRTPAEVEARAFFEAYLDQLDPGVRFIMQRHVRALLGEGR